MNKFLTISVLLMLVVTGVSISLMREPQTAPGSSDGQGKAAIGGHFSLTDQNGKTVNDTAFRGQPMVVAFGFTHCPDICPTILGTYTRTYELLESKADKPALVFISVDPARDTPQRLKEYFKAFDKRIVALTGTEEEIKQAAAAYKAYYAKSEQKPASSGNSEHADHSAHGAPAAPPGDYLMDHSGYIYVMDAQGEFVNHFSSDVEPEALAKALAPLIK